MFRSCPATGRLAHRFDAKTHRCACGRWERGFKPKCEPVKPRGECQICERQQALDGSGNLGHHGYKRPGWGFITGDCLGVGHKVYPATDALVIYLGAVRAHIAKCNLQLEELPNLQEVNHTYKNYRERPCKEVTIVLKKGDEADYRAGTPSFESKIGYIKANLENEIAFATTDEKRVVLRIANATELVAS